ncbi:MAG: hypothetical protein J5582_04635 [Ruminococcus sp.]|uniref:hypothetical protein n=1 Tax=Ruminococcus sp. TaxID=41978 RepID=UPI0025D47385|nr:hypothetical protein [Ruminococcus sp.]MBO4865838.1 hypothetical protein [Ruminococcus sp.]
MSKKITLEEKMEKRDKLKARIDKNLEDMKPTYKAYEKLEKEINAELEEIKQKEKNKIYEHVMSLFGYSLSPEDFIKKFDRIMNDSRNRGFVEQLKREQTEREKAKNKSAEQNIDANNSPDSLPCSGEYVTADKKIDPEV